MSKALASSRTEAAVPSGDFATPEEPREAIPAGARIVVFLITVGALAATLGATFVDHTRPATWTTFLILAVAAATAQLFGVHSTHNQAYHLAIVFVLAGALLLPPALVALLCVVQHVPEWLKERYPIEIQAFNIANYVLAALGAFAGARLVLGWEDTGTNSRTALAGVVGGAVFVLVNHGVLAGMLRVARGHSLRESRLFTLESLSTDLVLAVIGVGLAAWWNANLWFLPVAIAPLLLIHRALSIPRLRAAASLDAKTGLYNAGFLNSSLTEEMQRAARFNRPLSVIVADLDLLRKINNNYGHLSGDAVLCGVADVLREQLRPYDIAARFGGEEFAIILPETEFEEALTIGERIRAAVEAEPFQRHGSHDAVPATLSIGVASFPVHAQDSEELVHQADLALYRAKALGRNRVCGATPETRALKKLMQQTVVLQSVEPQAESEPRGFTPYGTKDRVDDRPGAFTRRWDELCELAVRARSAVATMPRERVGADRRVRALIALLGAAAGVLLGLYALEVQDAMVREPLAFGAFTLLVLALQLLSVDLYGSGAEAASAIGILAAGFVLGPGAAMTIAVLAAFAQWIRKRGLLHRALFDMANFSLSAVAAAEVYRAVADSTQSVGLRLLGAVAATVAYKALNSGLLCLVMSYAESLPFATVWNERFRWAGLHYLAFGPLAFASALAYEEMGLIGLMAFAVPPALLSISVRQYLGHTRVSVEEVRRANQELRQSNAELAHSNQRVRKTHLETIAALSRAMEAKDPYTGGHIERVRVVTVALAHKLGYRGDELDAIESGALLHDIGKIGIPETVINKRGPLTEEEWTAMREHPVISDYILSEVDAHPFVRQIARWSHERIDGQGYPDGLAGNDIPLPARIALVADAFDALTSDRPYRAGRGIQAALAELREHSGTQFCPTVVAALEEVWREAPHILGNVEALRVDVA